MKIQPMQISLIGKHLVREYWSTCYFLVIDIGVYSMWGSIIERNTGKVIQTNQVYTVTGNNAWDEWHFDKDEEDMTALEYIDSLEEKK